MTTTVRIPHRLEQTLAQYCTKTRRSKSEVIIELLEQRFVREPVAASPYEIACEAGFIGSFTSGTSTPITAKERVKAAIRQKHGHSVA
ncbi:MAG: CopG family transcriptional regulator [Betaproteobacteria bacterium]|nr:CopG family transcriptional regulator [Betaproteobacteria bacterium]